MTHMEDLNFFKNNLDFILPRRGLFIYRPHVSQYRATVSLF
ncbi:unnamed protein product [Larinioides sclopetarius]|uniref:Uncharacterized protein n=1 Tax=Larinioides sclopetarius TaxID=280406 RepID=A0AAV2BBB5_9ARAC